MSEAPTAIQKRQIENNGRGLALTSLDDMWRFSGYALASGLAPKGFDRAETIFIAIQMGYEVGLPPMAALQNIAVINGRPSIWGDAVLAVCRASGNFDESAWEETWEGQGDTLTAVCTAQRKGGKPCVRKFGVADAKLAALWGKAGPWTQYPKRMLQMRARSWALRDTFGDALRGVSVAEEAMDMPARDITEETTIRKPGESKSQAVARGMRESKAKALPEPPAPPQPEPEGNPHPSDEVTSEVASDDVPPAGPAGNDLRDAIIQICDGMEPSEKVQAMAQIKFKGSWAVCKAALQTMNDNRLLEVYSTLKLAAIPAA